MVKRLVLVHRYWKHWQPVWYLTCAEQHIFVLFLAVRQNLASASFQRSLKIIMLFDFCDEIDFLLLICPLLATSCRNIWLVQSSSEKKKPELLSLWDDWVRWWVFFGPDRLVLSWSFGFLSKIPIRSENLIASPDCETLCGEESWDVFRLSCLSFKRSECFELDNRASQSLFYWRSGKEGVPEFLRLLDAPATKSTCLVNVSTRRRTKYWVNASLNMNIFNLYMLINSWYMYRLGIWYISEGMNWVWEQRIRFWSNVNTRFCWFITTAGPFCLRKIKAAGCLPVLLSVCVPVLEKSLLKNFFQVMKDRFP